MEKLKCLIVDDEPVAQRILEGYLLELNDFEVVGKCLNALAARQILLEQPVDIMFLDLEMPKLKGFSFLKTLEKRPATIITTAYREFALEGFELGVVDYLLKPFSFERFLKALNKIENKSKETTKSITENRDYEYFKVDRKNIKVYFNEIFYIEGLNNYIKIHLEDQSLIIYHKLIDLQQKLPNDQFIRLHKSFIVSLSKIQSYNTHFVEISNKKLPIGNTYKDNFLNAL